MLLPPTLSAEESPPNRMSMESPFISPLHTIRPLDLIRSAEISPLTVAAPLERNSPATTEPERNAPETVIARFTVTVLSQAQEPEIVTESASNAPITLQAPLQRKSFWHMRSPSIRPEPEQ